MCWGHLFMTSCSRDADIIGIPYGTRLQQLVLVGAEVHVWIAVRTPRPRSYSDWQGTFLRVEPNGRVTRVTRDDNYTTDDEFVIREADK